MQASAHESLADLLMRFLAEVGSSSHSYAELAGRTASNINDVVRMMRVCCAEFRASLPFSAFLKQHGAAYYLHGFGVCAAVCM